MRVLRFYRPAWFPLLLLFISALCHAQPVKQISGNQSGVWYKDTIYQLSGDVTVSLNQLLTIQPGTTIQFLQGNSKLTIQGTLIAQGTIADSIRFIGGNVGYASQRGPIIVESTSQNCVFRYVSIDKLGYYYNADDVAAFVIRSSSTTVANCALKNTSGTALQLDNASPNVSNNIFLGNDNLDAILTATRLPQLSGNNKLNIGLLTEATTADVVLTNNNNYYRLLGTLTVGGATTFTVQPGTQVQFPAANGGNRLIVQGTLIAQGTIADSIRFIGGSIGYSTQRGPIVIESTSQNSVFKYVVIDKLGYYYDSETTPALIVRSSSCTIDRSSFRGTQGTALSIENVTATLSKSLFFSNTALDVNIGIDNLPNLTNNNSLKVGLRDEIMTSNIITLTANNQYYYLLSTLTVPASKKLILQPGTNVHFPATNGGNRLIVQGTLAAAGSATDSIHFAGSSVGYNTQSGPIVIENTSQNCILRYIVFNQLGYYYDSENTPALIVRSSSCTVERCSFRSTKGTALSIENAEATVSNCLFTNNDGLDVNIGINNLSNLINNNALKVGLRNEAMTANSAVLTANNQYYDLLADLTVPANKLLTVQPGAWLRFPAVNGGNQLIIQGTLNAQGTATDSIRFTGGGIGYSTQCGPIVIESTSQNSVIRYAFVDQLGYYYNSETTPALVIKGSSFVMKNCTVRNTHGAGIGVQNNALPTIQNNTFYNNSDGDINGASNLFPNVEANTNASVRVFATVLSQNAFWPHPGSGSRYVLKGTVTVNANYNLTIAPGTKVDFNNNSGNIVVNGSLTAIGTEAAKINFVKAASGTPLGGTLSFGPTSSGSSLIHVNTDRLGSVTSPAKGSAIELNTSNIAISNLTVNNSEAVGLSLKNASPTIYQSNFLNNKTGALSSGGNAVFRECGFAGNTTFGVNNSSATTTDTVDARNCWWGSATGPKPTGAGDSVSARVKYNPFNTQIIASLIPDVGISAVLAPASSCALNATTPVTVQVTNYGTVNASNIMVGYSVNNASPVTESLGAASLAPGATVSFTFTAKANFSAVGNYVLKCFTALSNDAAKTNDTATATVSHIAPLPTPAGLSPANNSTNLTTPILFSWNAVANAQAYDFYLWDSAATVPTTPFAANLTQTSFAAATNLFAAGKAYKWKVIAENNDCSTSSGDYKFRMKALPDLVVDSIFTPATVYSESPLDFYWKTKNKGGAATNTAWTESYYLTQSQLLLTNGLSQALIGSYLLGTANNVSALNAGASYSSSQYTYSLPVGIQGTYYILVKTNSNEALKEDSTTNNIKVSNPIAITLAPPPDLQVLNVVTTPANTVFADSTMKVNYTVANNGTGKTSVGAWTDRIYLSTSAVFNADSCVLLKEIPHSGVLPSGTAYTQTNISVAIPPHRYGTHYIHVMADAKNDLFESNFENNNVGTSNAISVFLNPAPNLTVSKVTLQADTVTNRQPVTFQWTERNTGAIAALPSWRTAFYLSQSPVLNTATAYPLGSFTTTAALNSLDSVTRSFSVTMPASAPEGAYYLYADADAGKAIYESQNNSPAEGDNTGRTLGQVVLINPDLKPILLQSTDTAFSEAAITVSYQVKNQSTANVFNASWTDRIRISTDNVLSANDTLLASVAVNTFVTANGTYTRQQTVTIPRGTSGKRYLIVSTDDGEVLTEKSETNDTLSKPIYIKLSPYPDLLVTAAHCPQTDTAGTTFTASYTVKNAGKGMANGDWDDYVFLSPTKNTAETALTYIGSVHQSRSLDTGATYTQQASFTLSPSLLSGKYYLLIAADYGNGIYENAAEGNNKTVGDSVQIAPLPVVDLGVDSASCAQASLTAGSAVAIKWTVSNKGNTPVLAPSWQDAVYLSNNPTLDASDRLLGEWTMTSPFVPGQAYTTTKTVTLPQDVSGSFYLLLVTDKANTVNDVARGNNTKVVAAKTVNAQDTTVVTVTQPLPSDLVVDSLTVPATGVEAQPLTFTYTIANKGTGATNVRRWADALYLSTDYALSSDDIPLAATWRNDSLKAGQSYTNSVQLFLPKNRTGNYVVIAKADDKDLVYEKNGESNNLRFAALQIMPQAPCDLMIDSIVVPLDTAIAGKPVTVKWTTVNRGANAANGYTKEGVYLSADTAWDSNDALLGFAEGSVNLAPLGSVRRTLTARITNLPPGQYYVLVRADVLDNFEEAKEDNNVTESALPVNVKIQALPLNVATMDTIVSNAPLYYKLSVPASLAGETMQLTLSGDSVNGAVNRIYLSRDTLPSQYLYQYAGQEPFKASQTILVPALDSGAYFITAIGNKPDASPQPVSLLAKIIPFGIASVETNRGGNAGNVTVKLTGAKFEPGMKVSLSGAEEITGENIRYVNPSTAFATFNLAGRPLGVYTVKATNGNNQVAQLPNGFTVEKVSPGGLGLSGNNGFTCHFIPLGYENNLDVTEDHPAKTGNNTIAIITVFYKNNANVDIPTPTVLLASLDSIPMSHKRDDFSENNQQLPIDCKEADGPDDVLRAGAGGSIKIYVRARGYSHQKLKFVLNVK